MVCEHNTPPVRGPPRYSIAARGLYVASPQWTSSETTRPYVLGQHTQFLLGTENYRPIPYDVFQSALLELSADGAVEISPVRMKELRDVDVYADNWQCDHLTHLLCDSVIIRLLKDTAVEGEMYDTWLGLGREVDLIRVAARVGLPHPFDNAVYPYRMLFHDPRDNQLPVLRP